MTRRRWGKLTMSALLALGCLGTGLAACAGRAAPALPLARVDIAGRVVVAEVPQSPAQRYQGLGGRKSLAPGQGMLFFFYQGGPQSMCMRDMNFPLDFIWLAKGRVAEISHQVPPAGEDMVVAPWGKMDLVLEAPGGWAQKHGVRPGQQVSITPLGRDFPAQLQQRLIMESHERP